MKWKMLTYLTLVGIVSGVLFSCYKSKNFSTNLTAQIDTAIVAQAYDQVRVVAVLDEVFNDVNSALTSQSAVTGASLTRTGRYGVTTTGSGDTVTVSSLCNIAVLLDTTDVPNSISLNYIGYSCDNSRQLNGNVTIYFNPGTSWSTAGDTLGVNINNLTVQGDTLQGETDTNKIRLNGTFYYINTSGGSLSNLTAGSQPVVQQIVSNYLGVLFNAADTATWLVARQRSYAYNNGGIQITTTGIDTVGGIDSVSEWGGNRYGNSFITAITTPLVTTSGCSYQVTAGQVQITNPTGLSILNFGLNSSGTATSCPTNGGTYYFQFSWSGTGGNPYSTIRPYPFH